MAGQTTGVMQAFDLELRGLSAPVLLVGVDTPHKFVARYFSRWPHVLKPHGGVTPFATLVQANGGFAIKSVFEDDPVQHETEVNAVCDLIALAARFGADTRDDEMCLHAAAVTIGAGAVVFPATRRAGKSLLTATLAERGYTVLGDDVLPVTTRTGEPAMGVATGAPVRLRLPLPKTAGPNLLRFAKSHAIAENRQYLYTLPPSLAEQGTKVPITAFVHLERGEGAKPEMVQMSRGQMLARLLHQNFARVATADRILADLFDLASRTPAFHLTYDRVSDGADILVEALGNLPVPNARTREPSEVEPGAPLALDPARRFVRSSGADIRRLEGEVFAVSCDLTRVMHLNAGAQRIWALLDQPTRVKEAIDILRTAFPDQDGSVIAADTNRTFKALCDNGLLSVAPKIS